MLILRPRRKITMTINDIFEKRLVALDHPPTRHRLCTLVKIMTILDNPKVHTPVNVYCSKWRSW